MDQENNIVEVGMAEMKMGSVPNVLVARGLGSCLAIFLYDPALKCGAAAHPMLPRLGEFKARGTPCRYVDYMISLMIDELQKKGAKPISLVAKLFGGSHMFSSIPQDSAFNIGARNIAVAREKLDSYSIKIAAEDVGGNYGRTILCDIATGKVRVRTMFFGEKDI